MSYDIRFKVQVAGTDKFIEVGDCGANITYNVRKIIELSTGLPWLNEANNGYCKDVMPCIVEGYAELMRHPEAYKPYESPNGWGTVAGVKNFFEYLMEKWWEYCEETDPDIVSVTTFWIE